MSRQSLEAAISAGDSILIDTSVVLAYLDGREAVSPAASLVIDSFVREGRNPAVISAVTVAETLVRPFAAGSTAVAIAEAFLRQFPNLDVADVSYGVAREAARVRSATQLKAPDALIIATAMTTGIRVIVSNDQRWRSALTAVAPAITLCQLDAHIPL